MNIQEEERRDAYERACRFLDAHASQISSINETPARREVDVALARIDLHEGNADRLGGQRAELTQAIHHLRTELRVSAMRPAIVIARAKLSDVPDLAGLTLPDSGATTAEITAAAHSLAATVRHHQQAFDEQSLPEGSVERMRALANALDHMEDQRRMAAASRTRSIVAVRNALKAARLAMTVVDALFSAHPAVTDMLLQEWKEVRRIG